jgi:hypothetical protein
VQLERNQKEESNKIFVPPEQQQKQKREGMGGERKGMTKKV